MNWDVTVTDTPAKSYLPVSSGWSGAATQEAAAEKRQQNTARFLRRTHLCIAVETLEPITSDEVHFLSDLGKRISDD